MARPLRLLFDLFSQSGIAANSVEEQSGRAFRACFAFVAKLPNYSISVCFFLAISRGAIANGFSCGAHSVDVDLLFGGARRSMLAARHFLHFLDRPCSEKLLHLRVIDIQRSLLQLSLGPINGGHCIRELSVALIQADRCKPVHAQARANVEAELETI